MKWIIGILVVLYLISKVGGNTSAPSYDPSTGDVSNPSSGLPSCDQWHDDCIKRNSSRTDIIYADKEGYVRDLCKGAVKYARNNDECE